MNWIEHIPTIIIGVMVLVDFIMALINNRGKGILEQLPIIEAHVIKLMEEAEAIKGLTGPQKKKYVLDAVEIFLRENSINFPIKLVSDIIENLIELTKKVNTK